MLLKLQGSIIKGKMIRRLLQTGSIEAHHVARGLALGELRKSSGSVKNNYPLYVTAMHNPTIRNLLDVMGGRDIPSPA